MIEATGNTINTYREAQKKYLETFGPDSLDRVILLDPLHLEETSVNRATKALEEAVQSDTPISPIPEEDFKRMIF